MKHNVTQCNTMDDDKAKYKTDQYNTTHNNAIVMLHLSTIKQNTVQFMIIKHNTIPYLASQHNITQ